MSRDMKYKKVSEDYASLKRQLDDQNQLAAKLRREIGTGTPDKLVSEKRIQLDQIETQLSQIEQEIAIAEWQQKQLSASMTAATTQPSKAMNFDFDPEWRQLNLAMKTTEHDLAIARTHYGEQHETVVELKEHLKFSQDRLTERESQLAKIQITHLDPIDDKGLVGDKEVKTVRDLPQWIKLLKFKKELFTKSLSKQSTDFDKLFNNSQALAEANEAITYKKDMYNVVRSRLDQNELERKVPGSIEILSRAIVPSEPSSDRRKKFTFMILFGALAAGMTTAHLRTRISQTITEFDDVQQATDKPFLGQLPLLPAGQTIPPELNPLHNEYIRMIRTAVLKRLNGKKGCTITVTSAEVGAGKTTTSIMLARSLAQC